MVEGADVEPVSGNTVLIRIKSQACFLFSIDRIIFSGQLLTYHPFY